MIPRCFSRILETMGTGGRGQPSFVLLELFTLLGTEHDGTVTGMAEAAKQWRTGEFQYRIKDTLGSEVLQCAVPFLRILGLIDERTLTPKEWKQIHGFRLPLDVAICGARFTAMQKRLAFADAHMPKDVDVDSLATLGSIRGLDQDEIEACRKLEPWDMMSEEFKHPTIEADLACIIVFSHDYRHESLGESPYYRVCAPPRKMSEDLSVEEIRKWKPEPGFDDTLDAWITLRAADGLPLALRNVLLVTSGPSFDRVECIAQQKLPDCRVYVIGYAAPASLNLSQYLNELSMLLFECDAWLKAREPVTA